MKKIALMIAFAILSLNMSAQINYRGFVESGASALFGESSGFTYHFSTTHGAKFGSVFLGVGIEKGQVFVVNDKFVEGSEVKIGPEYPNTWDKYFKENALPVYLDVRYYLNDNKLSPVFDAKAGSDDGFVSMNLFELGVGMRYEMSQILGLTASLFYRYNDKGTREDAYFDGVLHNAGLRLSFEF